MDILRAKRPNLEDRLRLSVAEAVQKLRSQEQLIKKPSIAETLDWAAALEALGAKELDQGTMDTTMGFVLKNEQDIREVRDNDLLH